jgi:hypothetical protein
MWIPALLFEGAEDTKTLPNSKRIWGTFESTTRKLSAKQVINLAHYLGAGPEYAELPKLKSF